MNRAAPFVPIITAFPSEEHGKMVPEEEEEEEDDVSAAAGDGGDGGGKKRRLGTDQVRALERSFEEKNRLSPELKSRLAHDLGLHPRQVAVWFQNRRARWKTKQLERDFTGLKFRHEALRRDFDSLRRENNSLLAEISALKSKLSLSADDEKMTAMSTPLPPPAESDSSAGVLTDDDGGLERGILCLDPEICTVDLFSDEHVPNLDWLCSDLAGNVAGAAIADGWL